MATFHFDDDEYRALNDAVDFHADRQSQFDDAERSVMDAIREYNAAKANLISAYEEIHGIVEGKADEMRDAFEERPHSWQVSDRGIKVEAWIDDLRRYADHVQERIDNANSENEPDEPDYVASDIDDGTPEQCPEPTEPTDDEDDE